MKKQLVNQFRRIKLIHFILILFFIPLSLSFAQTIRYGDVNNDSSVDIVDALLTAQYYVGLNPPSFYPIAADVDGNGSMDIVDALLIAQYYVGLINIFPVESATPAPTNPPNTGGMTLVGQVDTGLGHRSAWMSEAIIGNYMYVTAAHEKIKIFDVQNIRQPEFIKDTDIVLNDYVDTIIASGTFLLYGNYEESSFCSIDASDPLQPHAAGTLALASKPGDVALSGEYAFVGCAGHFYVIDISDPSAMEIVYETEVKTRSLSIKGNNLYLTTWADNAEFQVLDISNPANPQLRGSLAGNTPRAMTISNNYAYFVSFTSLTIVDISDPSTMSIVSEYTLPIGSSDAAICSYYNGFLYIAYQPGIALVNVTDPVNPSYITMIDFPGRVYSMNREDDLLEHELLFAICNSFTNGSRITLLDTSDPGVPVVISEVDGYGCTMDVVVRGSYAYMADGYGGIKIADVSDPTSPVLISGAETPGLTTHIDVSGNKLCTSNESVSVFDVEDPALPLLKDSVITCERAQEIEIANDYVFVADSPWALTVLDIANINAPGVAFSMMPAATPTPVSTAIPPPTVSPGPNETPIPSQPPPTPPPTAVPDPNMWNSKSISLENNYAYMCVSREPLVRIMDIASPTNPVEVGSYNGLAGAEDIYVSGNYAYVVSRTSDDLQILDVSNPAAPLLLGALPGTTGNVLEVIVSGNYAYLLIDRDIDTIVKVNVSNPASPVITGELELSEVNAYNIFIKDNYLYVANGWDEAMLLIYRIE